MSNELVENIKGNEAIASLIIGGFINTCNSTFNRQRPIYRQSNEPFEMYLKKEDIENKDVLTIASSGDFLIYILNNQPKSVSTFDINIFTKYYQDLKIGAILTLSYEEFLEFFYGLNAFNENSFTRILNILPTEIKNFWYSLLKNYNPEIIVKSKLFCQIPYSKNLAIKNNRYLKDEKNYLETRKNIYESTYSFHNLNYFNLDQIAKKFDTIFLSNLFDELHFYKSLKEIIKAMESCANTRCNDNGVVIASTMHNNEIIENMDEINLIDKDFISIKVKK